MSDLEKQILEDCKFKPYVWWRHIDCIFFLWKHGEEKLMEFIKELNAKYPTIKFTAEWSSKSINFLDVNFLIKDGKIETDLHIKPTDSHQYLDSSSFHPFHCKKGIPYSPRLET